MAINKSLLSCGVIYLLVMYTVSDGGIVAVCVNIIYLRKITFSGEDTYAVIYFSVVHDDDMSLCCSW